MNKETKKQMKKLIKSWVPKVMAIFMVVVAVGAQAYPAFALSLTSMSDNMSRQAESTASNHEIKFVTPTGGGIATGETVTLTFTGFNATSVNNIDDTDVDVATGSSNNCTTATFTEINVGATNGAAQWGVAAAGGVITLTAPSSGTPLAADRCLRIRIGTNAVNQVTGAEQITNGTAATAHTIGIAGTFGDTGTIAVDIITNDQVVVTAQVDPSITFAVSDSTIGFGSLSASDDRFATGDTLGSSTAVVAHTLSAGTNATSGYILYMLGDTLESGANSITAPAGPQASTVGSEQFGLHLDASGGTGSVDPQYGTASQYGFGSTDTVQDNIASAAGPTATTTYSATYVANIDANTEAGAYSTTLTYTATAEF